MFLGVIFMQNKWEERKSNQRYSHIVQKIIFSALSGGVSMDISIDWTNEQEVKEAIKKETDKNVTDGFTAINKNSGIAACIDAAFGHGYSSKKLVNFSFMKFYNLLKELSLQDKPEAVKQKPKNFELHLPYKLAKECFVTYAQGVKYYQKKNKINICDLFTYNELIELGGN